MAVCAQPQDKVDDTMKQCELKFKVWSARVCSVLSSKIAEGVSTIFVGRDKLKTTRLISFNFTKKTFPT